MEKSKMSVEERMALLRKNTLPKINKQLGDGTVTLMSDKPLNIPRSTSGSLKIDAMIGGGLPLGRMIEIFGPESSGKSTLALAFCGAFQRAGKLCAYIDVEQALSPSYAQQLGVDMNNLLFSQPSSGEDAFKVATEFASSGLVDLIILDSVAALVPEAELNGEISDQQMGLHGRLMSKGCRMLVGELSRNNCTMVFINQLREKIGVMFGNPETTPGGRALKFYSSIRFDVRRSDAIKEGANQIGHHLKVKTVKNKVAPPFKECVLDLIYGKGLDRMREILDLGVEMGHITKSGSWYAIGSEKIGQGIEAAKAYLANNPEVAQEIESKILQAAAEQTFGITVAPVEGEDE